MFMCDVHRLGGTHTSCVFAHSRHAGDHRDPKAQGQI